MTDSATTDTIRCHLLILVLLGGLTLSGCAVVPTSRLTSDAAARCEPCRDNVHIIFVRSPGDPADTAGLSRVAESFCEAGFRNSSTFNLYHEGLAEKLACRVREIHACHPGCRVMLIGYSSGALIARGAAKRVEREGICIDTLVYLDAAILNFIACTEEPCNVRRHVLIYREGLPLPKVYGESSVCRVEEWNHFRVPTSQCAYDRLLCEAIQLADEASRCRPHVTPPLPIPTPKVPYEELPTLPKPASKPDAKPDPQAILLPAPRTQPAWLLPGGIEFDASRIASIPR